MDARPIDLDPRRKSMTVPGGPGQPKKRIRFETHTRVTKLSLCDGRTAEAKLLRRFQRELINYVGGCPDPMVRRLIERAAHLQLRLHMMDISTMRAGDLTEHNSRIYLSWHNSLVRTFAALMKMVKPAEPKSRQAPDKVQQLLRSVGNNNGIVGSKP